MRPKFSSLLSAAAIAFLLGACTTKKHPLNSSINSHYLRWTIQSEPQSLDWTACSDPVCHAQAALIMEGLTGEEGTGEERKAVPSLAASWESPDPATLIFRLRKGVTWSDGEPLTSQHFLLAWKRLLTHCGTLPQAARFFSVRNARAFCEKRASFSEVGMEAPDPRTLRLHFAGPHPFFPRMMSHPSTWPIRSEHAKNGIPAVSLGPFVLDRWVRGAELHYVRNPRYHGEPVPLAGVVVTVVPSEHQRVQLFLDGETDLVDEIPSALAASLRGQPDLVALPTSTVVALVFNTARRPFHLLAARQAFEHALRRDEMLSLMRWPHLIADALLPSPSPAGVAPSPALKFDVSAAHDLLAPLRAELSSARPTLAPYAGEVGREVAENLQAQWLKNLEVRVDLVALPGGSRSQPSLQLAPIKPSLVYPVQFLETVVARARWHDSAADVLLEQARGAQDAGSAAKLLAQAETLLVERDAVVLPLFHETRSILRRPIAQSLPASMLAAGGPGEPID